MRDEILCYAQNDKEGALGALGDITKHGSLILRYAQDDKGEV